MNCSKLKSITFLFLAVIVLSAPLLVDAQEAELFLTPSSNTYNKGSKIYASVKVNTDGADINAAKAELKFNPKFLQVVSVSKAPVFSLWVIEPEFNNRSGIITFSGGSPNEFSGKSKTLISVVFRTINTGETEVNFNSGIVTKADGKGTDILEQTRGGVYNIAEPVSTANLPGAPSISSPTHPESENWYTNNSPKFEWGLPQDVTAVSLLASRSKKIPGILHSPPISNRQVKDLEDGEWYFSAQFRNNAGWGKVDYFKFQIDTGLPESFAITKKFREDLTNPKVSFDFDAKDKVSGISHYEIWINNEKYEEVENETYTTPPLDPGEYEIRVKAVDFAGNYLEEKSSFKIKALEMPKDVSYPEKLNIGEEFIVSGTADPSYKVQLKIKKPNGDTDAKTAEVDKEGNFKIIYPGFSKKGNYEVWTKTVNDWGASSKKSETAEIKVRSSFIIFTKELIIHYAIAILSVILFAVLILLYVFWWELRKINKKQESDTHKKIKRQIKYLNKKIKAEKNARKELKKLLNLTGYSAEEKIKEIELKNGIKLKKPFFYRGF